MVFNLYCSSKIMTLPEVIDLSSEDEDCMDDLHAEVGRAEATFPRSDKDIRKGCNITETVKLECTEQATDLADSVKGSTFAMNKEVDNLIAAPDQRVPLQTSYRDLHQPSSIVLQHSADTVLCRQFWKAGDYEARSTVKTTIQSGMDHVRVHPKFLHSNATSHKWALGAIAELLDNAVDEIANGSTFVNVDKIACPRDNSPALLVQDDGGGMDPDCIRQCMSLGYSRKTTNTTIGQYGNGFKTSTMRLGADVIVFSRCNHSSLSTQSIGLLSYTFLRETGHEDVVVPMVDYEILPGGGQKKLIRSTPEHWSHNLSILLQWSPYTSESDLLKEFEDIGPHGTKIVVYNLWLNDDGQMELDFNTDKEDIQLRGAPDDKQLSQHVANRLHYSLRVYSSILYLHMPDNFKIILRGRVVEHYSIGQDLKFPEYILYKPQVGGNKEVSVITTIGFTKEAPLVNVHGFNVYHKNRLIMPFWRVFHENSSRGRGVVGVLEANFIEPAHDKQDFERTAVLLRLETRLKLMTIEYWNLHCSLIGYQPSNMKANKSRNVPNSTSGPASSYPAATLTSSHGAGTFASTSSPGSGSTGIENIPQSKLASTPSNFVPLSSGLQVEQRNTSGQHMNVGANNPDVDLKPMVLKPVVVNQSHLSNSVTANLIEDVKSTISGMPSASDTSPNTSVSDETPNAPTSAPYTPPQQSPDLEDLAHNSFRHRGDRMMDQINEDINNAHDRDQGRTEDSVNNLERDHFSLNGSLSAFPNGCPSTMSKSKRKISDVILSELESSKRQANRTNNALANDNRLNIQCALDDVDIGSIPISEEPVATENGIENCKELKMLLEENRRLRVQCLEYDSTEKELQQKVTDLENELQEVQSEYANLVIESQSHIVKEET